MKTSGRMRTTRTKSHAKKKQPIGTGRRVVEFPQVKGKILESVEFSTRAEYHAITLCFRDKTELVFDLEPGFTVFTEYADWKTGNGRPIKRWRAVRSRIFKG